VRLAVPVPRRQLGSTTLPCYALHPIALAVHAIKLRGVCVAMILKGQDDRLRLTN
jgi:hypothetical protein